MEDNLADSKFIWRFTRIARDPISLFRKFRAGLHGKRNLATNIPKLTKSSDTSLQRIGGALKATVRGEFDPQEKVLIDRIEAIRHDLLNNKEMVEIIDFGAGDEVNKKSGGTGHHRVKNIGEVCAEYSRAGASSALLFHLVRTLKPTSGLELGTCLGLSAAYQAGAMQLNGRGRFITLEGSPGFAEIAAQTLATAELSGIASVRLGAFTSTIDKALKDLAPVDYLFIDGHHDGDATIEYFNRAKPHARDGAVFIFDDIFWSPSMENAWRHILDDPAVSACLTLQTMGIAVLNGTHKQRLTLCL